MRYSSTYPPFARMRPLSTISCAKSVAAIRPYWLARTSRTNRCSTPMRRSGRMIYWNQQMRRKAGNIGASKTPLPQKDCGYPLKEACPHNSIFAPQLLSSQLDRDLSANIVTLARKYEISPSVLLLSCWQILLWRLSGQSEFVVGVTSDGRTYEGLHEALGLFGKSLPMICHLEGDLRLSELLRADGGIGARRCRVARVLQLERLSKVAKRHRLTISFACGFRIQGRPREILRRRCQLRHSKSIRLLRPICA